MKTLTLSLLLILPASLSSAQENRVAPTTAKASSDATMPKKTPPGQAAESAEASLESKLAEILAKHSKGSVTLATDQDELSADVQDLMDGQTNEKVIRLLENVEEIMGETIDRLDRKDTGGDTLAAQTEIIEKIFQAAKKKQQQSQQNGQQSPQGSAMLDMMQRMMGKKPGGQKGQQPGKGKGSKGGEGQKGDSDAANGKFQGKNEGNKETRSIPKKAGKAGSGLPSEFQKALDAYNK